MGSVVHSRLEVSPQAPDLRPGLHARVHDALWLLARQWQFGEFEGMDGGTPVATTLAVRSTPLAAWRPAGGKASAVPEDRPLEALVEHTPAAPTWRQRRVAGLRLARALRAQGVQPAPLVSEYPLDVPDAAVGGGADASAHATTAVTPEQVAVRGAIAAGRVCDPAKIAAAAADAVLPLVGSAGKPVLTDFLAAWAATWPVVDTAQTAWQPTELEYEFTAAVADESAPSFTGHRFGGGVLDWYDVDAGTDAATLLADAAVQATAADMTVTHAVPTAVTFRGAPNSSYWRFDDARTDYGAIDAYPTELGKLLLPEFTACFANTWYRLPVRVPYGSSVQVAGLATVDTFGVATVIAAAGTGRARTWRMFEHTDDTSPAPWLFLPPVLADAPTGPASEEVALQRDPAADLCWAIEKVVTNAVGTPVRRGDDLAAQRRQPPADTRAPLPDTWLWRLQTSVPENWIPLVPTRGRNVDDDYVLVQGMVLRYTRATDGTVSAVPVLPASRLLSGDGLTLPEREVPRAGLTVRLLPRSARWVDGSRLRWTTWRSTIGHGEASSGLAYDGLHPEGQQQALGQ